MTGVALQLAAVLLRAPVFHTRLYRPMVLNIGLSAAPAVVLFLVLAALVLTLALSGIFIALLSVMFAQTIYAQVAWPNDDHHLA